MRTITHHRSALAVGALAFLIGHASVASAQGAPKAAVVVAGDPDAAIVAAGRALVDELSSREEVLLPSAGATRALLGERDDAQDGLVSLRAALYGENVTTSLRAIGARLSANALAVLTRGPNGIRLEVFDVSAGRFYEGDRAVNGAGVARYVERRAAASQRRVISPAVVATASPEIPTEEEPVTERTFFQKNWAYFAGAALLAGVATFFIVRQVRSDDEIPPPVLRFRPGG